MGRLALRLAPSRISRDVKKFLPLLAALATGCQDEPTPGTQPKKGPTEAPPASMVAGTPGASDVASSALTSEVDCDKSAPGRARARLSWAQASRPGSEQRVAVTIYGDGFEKGQFELSDPLPPGQTSLVWDQLKGQAFHYWRVVTRQGNGWVTSDTGSFEGPTCVGGSKLKDPSRKSKP